MRYGGPLSIAALFCRAVLGQSSAEDGADKKAFVAVCGSCHTVGLVDGIRSAPEWNETIVQMVKLGARGSDEQFDRLLRYLLRNLTKINVNTATASEIAPVLDITVATAATVIQLRTEIGKFKSLDELKRIPGVDAAKLEARKERIVF